VRGRLDAVLALAAVAPLTHSIGLVAVTDVTHTEPFHLAKNLATVDLVSHGRAGWWPHVSTTAEVAALFGRKPPAPIEDLWAEAGEVIDVVRRLWDSWEDGAVIRDVATSRYIDRDKIHYVDFTGRFFSVRGPSITPRSPQGQPLVVVGVADDHSASVAAAHADIAVIGAPDATAAQQARADLRRRTSQAGRDPDDLTVLLSVNVVLDTSEQAAQRALVELDELAGEAHTETVSFAGTGESLAARVSSWFAQEVLDGVVLRPAELAPGLASIAGAFMPSLRAAGLLDAAASDGLLRQRFGLSRPASRYAPAGERAGEVAQ
jgi:alkanesulfonate monooxygenase SsuD/methylene tetrahydromethanopterin reductase-like flavin-dependent oxidoreductase (luciferase family)